MKPHHSYKKVKVFALVETEINSSYISNNIVKRVMGDWKILQNSNMMSLGIIRNFVQDHHKSSFDKKYSSEESITVALGAPHPNSANKQTNKN